MVFFTDGIKETLIFTGIHPLRSHDCLTQFQDLFGGLITGEVITSMYGSQRHWTGERGLRVGAVLTGVEILVAAGFFDDFDLLSTARSFLPLMDIFIMSGQLLRRALTEGLSLLAVATCLAKVRAIASVAKASGDFSTVGGALWA
jgi:hypothetical protein